MSLKLFYSQLNLHSSALHECLKRCSTVMQACLETYDDTLYCNTMIPCIVPHRGRGYNGFGEKIRFWGRGGKGNANGGNPLKSVASPLRSGAKRQRKWGKSPKSVAFKAGKKPKRQRKWGKALKFVAFSPRSRAKRQRKWGTRRDPLPLKPARSLKGNVNGGSG